jgi:hypothetical protein
LDYLIVDHEVKGTVLWTIEKDPSADPGNPLPLKYVSVAFGARPNPAKLKYFRDLLTGYKITPPF